MADNHTGQHIVKNSYIQMLSSLRTKSYADLLIDLDQA